MPTLAFPGAEGFGCYAQGGRGGPLYTVTTLDDSDGSEDRQGTLRHAIEQAPRPVVVAFDPDLCGTIKLRKKLKIEGSHITIDGSGAHGAGICIAEAPVMVIGEHIIVRYLRFRGAGGGEKTSYQGDAITIRGPSNHVIVDHCSTSWGTDEVLSVNPEDGTRATNITIQWCIISEPLGTDGAGKRHRFASIFSGGDDDRLSVLHCFFVHFNSRGPRVGHHEVAGSDRLPCYLDFRGNLLYNGGDQWGYNGEPTNVPNRMNFVRNVYVSGPDTQHHTYIFFEKGSTAARAFFSHNTIDGSTTDLGDHYDLVRFDTDRWTESQIEEYMATPEFEVPLSTVTPGSSRQVYQEVLEGAGCTLPARDAVDARLVSECQNPTGSGGAGGTLVTPESLRTMPERYVPPRLCVRRRAVLCYTEKNHSALINDAQYIGDLLREHGYDIRVRNSATKSNYRSLMKWLVDGMQRGDRAFFYSGSHGAQVGDDSDGPTSDTEADGKDEGIITADGKKLRDDDVRKRLTGCVADGAYLVAVITSCHSGTMADMEHNYWWKKRKDSSTGKIELSWRHRDDGYHDETGNVVVYTACEDSESTWNHTYGQLGRKHTALGGAFLLAMGPGGSVGEEGTHKDLLHHITRLHATEDIDCTPCLACHPKRYYREKVTL